MLAARARAVRATWVKPRSVVIGDIPSLSRQFIEQSLGIFEVGGVEA
jgi:hypothetical protein